MKKTSEQLAWLIRRHGIEMTHLSGGSHIGAVLSAADILAVLYADILRYDPEDPEWDGRDRFIRVRAMPAPPYMPRSQKAASLLLPS